MTIEKSVFYEYEEECLLVTRTSNKCVHDNQTFLIAVGKSDGTEGNGIEIEICCEDFEKIVKGINALWEGKKDNLVDCSYHEGSYLIEKNIGQDIEMQVYEFVQGKVPLRFFHIKREY